MKILITGATGFIGIRIIDALLAGGHEIFALCRNLEKAKAKLPDNCHIIIGDITDKNRCLVVVKVLIWFINW